MNKGANQNQLSNKPDIPIGNNGKTPFVADIYLRLSKEDGDKEESDSIANQRDLILDFLKSHPDISIHKIRIDDGYSGVDFSRPAFIEMINDIQEGKVNCVIVKDFSRFGRNYIESGRYIQVLFPRSGVRFIAINDSYDSSTVQGYTSNIIVPFKNLLNDAYSGDIATKVRSNLDMKRKKGDFVGAFAVYGYMKASDAGSEGAYDADRANGTQKNAKNQLIIDDFAADVVRDIFKWKLEGLSAQGIADRLNTSGTLSPMEYKRHKGLRYNTTFKINTTAQWQSMTVKRILQNAVYTGVLEQGKRSKPNYKVRKCVPVPKEQWICIEDAHEPIIQKSIFDTVQQILKHDTRAVKSGENVMPLSGIIYCGGCGGSMIRKTNTKNGVRYGYFICANHKKDKTFCSTHMISAPDCEEAVYDALQIHVASVLDVERAVMNADNIAAMQHNVRKLTARLQAKQEEIKRYNDFRLSLYESYRDGIIKKTDFQTFKASYDAKIEEAEIAMQLLQSEIDKLTNGDCINDLQSKAMDWIDRFRSYTGTTLVRDIATGVAVDTNLSENPSSDKDAIIQTKLERKTVVELIERVNIHMKGRIEVVFRYYNEFVRLCDSLDHSPDNQTQLLDNQTQLHVQLNEEVA